jgi:superfamily II DNA/RNA helicase
MVTTNSIEPRMDFKHVNIVFNYDIPDDADTYLRRVRSKENLFFIY